MRFPERFLDEVRQKNDIETIVSSYVRLKRTGRYLVGLCPFHNESTPSFTVYTDDNSFYCYGCQAGGDVINFIRRIEGYDYSDAVRFLAERAGIPMPTQPKDDGMTKLRLRTLEANREAARFFHSCLNSPQGAMALEYLRNRGLSDSSIRRFGLGYAPDSWDALSIHMKKLGYTNAELEAMDLSRQTKRGGIIDRFRNRLMIPFIDVRGNVLAFGGRVFDDSKPKYLNTKDTLVYKKGDGIFGLNYAKNGSGRSLILCEGYMDVIAFHQYGFTNAVAGLGTALTAEQAQLLARYADEILLAYDSDEAGREATQKALKVLSATTLRLRVLKLRGGKDPDEILKKKGPEFMRSIISGAENDTEFLLGNKKIGLDLTTDDGRLNYLRAAVPILASLKNDIERDIYISRICQEAHVAKEAVVSQIAKERRSRERRRGNELFQNAKKELSTAYASNRKGYVDTSSGALRAQQILVVSLIQNPDFWRSVKDKLSEEDFTDDFLKKLFLIIRQRIINSQSTELSFFNEDLDNDEMSRLTELIVRRRELGNTVGECLDCIQTIKKENLKRKNASPAELSDEEYLKLFSND